MSTSGQEMSLQERQPLDRCVQSTLEAVEGCIKDNAYGGTERGIIYALFCFHFKSAKTMYLDPKSVLMEFC